MFKHFCNLFVDPLALSLTMSSAATPAAATPAAATPANSCEFFDQFDQLTHNASRLEFMDNLRMQKYPYHLEAQPEAVLQRFYYDQDVTPTQIVCIFLHCFGQPIICREASYSAGCPMTIYDCLNRESNGWENNHHVKDTIIDLMNTFEANGVESSRGYYGSFLESSYRSDPVYASDPRIGFPCESDDESDSDDQYITEAVCPLPSN